MAKTINITVSTNTVSIIADYAMAHLTIKELGAKLSVAVAKDGITTRVQLHSTVVEVLMGNPDYAVDIQSTGYFAKGTAGQQAYQRVMSAAFPKANAAVAAPKTVTISRAQRAAIKACKELGVTLAMFKAA